MKNMVALIDTDVLADCIIKREPFFGASKAVIDLRRDNKYHGFITAQCIPNLFIF
jgi:predicted nucleic acid-binding protein